MVNYEGNNTNWHVNASVRNKFAIVKYSAIEGLQMAVDRRMMKLESESIARYYPFRWINIQGLHWHDIHVVIRNIHHQFVIF